MGIIVCCLIAFVGGGPLLFGSLFVTPTARSIPSRIGWGIVQIYLLFSAFYNYIKAATTRAQSPQPPDSYLTDGIPVKHENPFMRHAPACCPKCGSARVPRTHHCSVSERCIFRYDHFCPWVGVIGAENYPYFFLFVLYASAGCLISALNSLSIFTGLDRVQTRFYRLANEVTGGSMVGVLVLISSVAMGLIWSFAIGFLLMQHVVLISQNRTSTDSFDFSQAKSWARSHGLQWANPYDMGLKRNWQQVFGNRYPVMLVVLFSAIFHPEPLTGDALADWPIRSDIPPALPHIPAELRGDEDIMEAARQESMKIVNAMRTASADGEEYRGPKQKSSLFQRIFGESQYKRSPGQLTVAAYSREDRFSGVYIGTLDQLRTARLVS